jgi:tetratricopeptide (TPR) repeat protein
MNCCEIEPLLGEYVDGELETACRAEVKRHVDRCRACRRTVEELEQLGQAIQALPRGLAPERDLLPGIRTATVGRRRPWPMWIAVAASLLVLSTVVWIGLSTPDRRGTAEPVETEGIWSVARVNRIEFELAEQEYEQAAARLLQTLDDRDERLSRQTRELVEENLRIIDQAIDELREVLQTDPGDTKNGHALNSLYRQKIEFLWRMSRLSS